MAFTMINMFLLLPIFKLVFVDNQKSYCFVWIIFFKILLKGWKRISLLHSCNSVCISDIGIVRLVAELCWSSSSGVNKFAWKVKVVFGLIKVGRLLLLQVC